MTDLVTSSVTSYPQPRNHGGRSHISNARRHLNECCNIALKFLLRGLPKMLDQVDDSLFQLAEKADHDNTQKLYFDAMREVRIKRPGIEKYFKEYLTAGFESLEHVDESCNRSLDNLDFACPDLMLVDDDALEESLAVTNMSNRIMGLCKEELFALDMRIGWLLDDTALEDHDNPLAPRTICDAFARACSEIDATTEIRLIVLKLFDKHMVGSMHDVYQEINQYLVRNDILPYIRTKVKKQPHTPHKALGGQVGEAGEALDPNDSPITANGQAFTGFAASAPASSTVVAGVQAMSKAPVVDTAVTAGSALPLQLSQELLTTLQQVMRVNGNLAQAEPGVQPAPPGPELLERLTVLQTGSTVCMAAPVAESGGSSTLRDLRKTELGTELNHGDDLMIDVVAMMFDYIFDDVNIPAPMKVLIGRLQIPLLKVALLDKGFFSRRFHPARKLLNVLADAAVGWSEEQAGDDGLYPQMELTVQRVLDEFEDQVGVIADILAEFEAFLAEESRQAEENAWWSAKVIQGRERLASARSQVAAVVDERLAGIDYTFLKQFVHEYWQSLLLTAFVKDGEDSAHWQEALEVLDDLVWSVTPMDQEQDRTRLSGMLPNLLARLKQGVARISLSQGEAGQLLAKLARIHLAQVRGQALPAEDELDTLQSGALPPVAPSPIAVDDATCTGDEIQADTVEVEPLGHDQQRLREALESANRRIYEEAQNRPECSGMGTTMVAAWFHDGQLIAAHAGDSRLYRLRDGCLEQMTLDHSLRQQMVSNGFYTMEEAKQAIASNLVTRALGVDPEVDIEVHDHEVRSGDIYLLCSDGLSDLVEDESIADILNEPDMELEPASEALIRLANDNGGTDNISVSLVRVWQAADTQIQDSDPLELIQRTDVGRRRAHNEDAQGDVIEAGLVILADGMGGYNAGEVASRVAIDSVIESFSHEASQVSGNDVPQLDPGSANTDINFTALNALFDSAGINNSGTSCALPEIELDETSFWSQADDISEDCEEIILESDVSAGSCSDDDEGYAEQVAAMEIGAWVEFRNRGDTAIRARLTWISESTGKYLFTDRHGHKVVDASPAGLALEFRRASAVFIEDAPLFERAVNHLMARLRPDAG